MRETEVLARFHHENVIGFYGSIREGGRLKGIVMELADCDLSAYLASRTDTLFSLLEFVRICHDVLAGMVHIHCHGCMHRDIKPANILVFRQRDGSTDMPRFCLGGFTSSREFARELTENVGTATYMAPEVMDGEYDERVDVFSFGVMMCEVYVNGVLSLASVTRGSRLKKIQAAVASLQLSSPDLARFLERCCSRDHLERYRSSEALQTLLRYGAQT